MSYRERVTPERKIGSPNMSRKGLRGNVGTMASPPFSNRLELPTNSADNLALRSRKIPRAGLSAFSDESDTEEPQFIRSSQTSNIKKYRTVSSTSRSTVEESQSIGSSSSIASRLQYGLDSDSDGEVYSPSPQIARPMIIRRGITSLLRKAPSSSSTTSAENSEIYSNSINGRTYSSRMNNHIHTSSVTTATETSERDATNGYYLTKWHILQQSRWKDILRKSSNYIHTKITNFLSIICFYTILWSSHLLTWIKIKFSTRNSSRVSPIYTKVRNFLNNKLTTTKTTTSTTTVLSRKQTIITYLQDTYSWYGERRKASPFLWGWLPLLLLLLLIPFLVYGRGERDQWTSSQMYKSNSFLYDGLSFISQKAFLLLTVLSDVAYRLFNFLQYLIFFIYESVIISCTWLVNLIYYLFNGLRSAFLTDVESRTKSSDSLSESYSVLTIFSTGFSYLSKGAQYASSSLASSASKVWVLGAEGLQAVWNGLLWILFTSGSLISSVSSGVFGYVCLLGSEIGKLPHKVYMSIPTASKSTLSPAPSFPIPHSLLQPNLEDLVQQIILNPALHGLILSSISEREKSLRENLLSEFRDSLESDIQKLKAEIPPTQKQVKGLASKSEIHVLKTQVDNLLYKFANVENILNGVLSKQEQDYNSVADIEDMKLKLQEMSASVAKLNDDIKSLQDNQTAFEVKLKSCCQNTSVTLEQMRNHLSVLLSDLVNVDAEGNQVESLRANLREWMGKYFVAKEQLETRLNDLSFKMEATSSNAQETQHQTVEQVMNSIVDQIRSEMRAERERLQEHMDKNKEDYDKDQAELRSVVEQATAGTGGEQQLLYQFVKSLSSDEMEPDLYEKVVDALRPFISVTVDKKLNDDLPSVIDEKVSQAVDEHVLTAEMKIAQMEQRYSVNLQRNFSIAINDSDIDRIVKAALLKYDADKTGMVDHALESGGGSIVSTRCTEGYQGHQAEVTIFGYPLYRYSTNTPRSIIQPERNPGQCYAFKGSQGYIVIQFARPVRISAFTLEHIPKVLTPSGTIDSAPREFSISGLQKLEEEGFEYGTFVYKDNDEEPLQYFPVQNFSEEYYNYVELKIHSNHGNMLYTCIYRFRVHGVRSDIMH